MRKTGKNMEELRAIVRRSRRERQGELRTTVMRELGLGYSDANILVHAVQKPIEKPKVEPKAGKKIAEISLDSIYKGSRASLRPIHEAVTRQVSRLGEYVMIPEKGCVSLRRRKQFILLRPISGKRLELGLNVKDLPPSRHLVEEPRGSDVNYTVQLTDPAQVDAEVSAWIKFAYEDAE